MFTNNCLLFPKDLFLSVTLTPLHIVIFAFWEPSTYFSYWDFAGGLTNKNQPLISQERDTVPTAPLAYGWEVRWPPSLGKSPHDFLLLIINLFKSYIFSDLQWLQMLKWLPISREKLILMKFWFSSYLFFVNVSAILIFRTKMTSKRRIVLWMAWWYLRSGITQPSAQASKKGRREVGDKGDSQYWLDSGDSLNVAERIELKKKKKVVQAMTK